MAVAFPHAAHAIEWRLVPYVAASATYTDNANQSEDNPDNALVLTTTPGFSLNSEGSRRIKASVQYGMTAVARFGDDESDDLNHNLNAVGKAELVEDFLFVDGSARISQELISLFGSPADATINDENRATVGTYSISPYIQKRLGTFANVQARYTNSGAIFEGQTAADASANAFNASLTSGTRFDDLSWGLNYSIRKAENRNGATAADNADTTLESASATAGYALSRKFRVFGTVGQDWNDYFSTTGTSGSSYSVGFGWSPTRRTSLEASAGERYFGRTFGFSASHRTRLSRWNVRYYEDVSDVTQRFLDEAGRIFWVCSGSLYETPDVTEPVGVGDCQGPISAGQLASDLHNTYGVSEQALIDAKLLNISTTSGIYIIKGLTARVSWDIKRWGFGVGVQDTRRLYQVLGSAEDHIQGVNGFVRYRLSPRTSANGSMSVTRTSLDTTAASSREDDTLNLNASLNHRYTKDFTGALTFRHTARDSNGTGSDYKENALTASVNLSF